MWLWSWPARAAGLASAQLRLDDISKVEVEGRALEVIIVIIIP
jgi:hypothetical protein